MKKSIISKYLLPAVALLTFVSCDNIDADDRYLELDEIQPRRAVLMEEFTGQMCTNCPEGHEIVASLREQYGTSFIPVSIHAGNLALKGDIGGIQGLATDAGEVYYDAAGKPNLPSAVINRNTGAIDRAAWASTVRAELEKEAPADIELSAEIENNQIAIDVTLKSNNDIDCNLQLWIVESGISAYQYDNGNDVIDYVHNHVFRAAVNGVDGDPVEIRSNVFLNRAYAIDCDDVWVRDNLLVVAFIYNSNGVLQATEIPVAVARR